MPLEFPTAEAQSRTAENAAVEAACAADDAAQATKPEDRLSIGFDIGGTNLRASVVSPSGQVLTRVHRSSDGSVEALEDGIVDVSQQLIDAYPQATSIGLAVAGFLDSERKTVRFAPHLPWRDANVFDRLQPRLTRPLQLEHDANSAAWGEYRYGAAQGADNWVLFALGTGIGGAMMTGGQIYRGAYGTAPEFGHLTVVPGGRQCSCGKKGCLERYCSGTALATTARELAESGHYASSLIGPCREGRITGADVVHAARQGDQLAMAAVNDFAGWLGRGLSLVADVFDPELIVIGGGVAAAADQYLDVARREFARQITGAGHRPLADIELARLGADAGMIGVADLARYSF